METPSSTRRMTRSQTSGVLFNSESNTSKKMEDSDKGLSKSKSKTATQDRSALIDITNDSPIVGLASGSWETPVSSVAKRSNRWKRTPGSGEGEALLRGQVKTLLQRVEEEMIISKFSLEFCGPLRSDLETSVNSPAGILAPTPANTPQVFAFINGVESIDSLSKSPIEDQLKISQLVNKIFEGKEQGESGQETEKDLISRSLFVDFSEKSDCSSDCSSVVTYQGAEATVDRGSPGKSAYTEDDVASIWSIQVNTSTQDEDEEEVQVIEDGRDYGEEDEEEEGDILLLDELCDGINKISVNGGVTFKGQHIRFEYNSDDELVEECSASNEVLRLKELPTPKGKHLRFQDDAEE